MILKSETYNFHRLDLSRQAGFIVTIYDEDGLRLAATVPLSTSAEALRKRGRSSITKSRDRDISHPPALTRHGRRAWVILREWALEPVPLAKVFVWSIVDLVGGVIARARIYELME